MPSHIMDLRVSHGEDCRPFSVPVSSSKFYLSSLNEFGDEQTNKQTGVPISVYLCIRYEYEERIQTNFQLGFEVLTAVSMKMAVFKFTVSHPMHLHLATLSAHVPCELLK
jgi:hypothetical protein